ncbi:MAG: rRNA cytosine-C5-methyltransferase [Bacteroidia bacterium]|nr:MAG: rRNA cytosine-C5-methyltransferase [Bacteroidia bacterium]
MHKALSLALESIKKSVSIDEQQFLEAHQKSPKTSIKLNTNKIKDTNTLEFILGKKIQWADNSFYVDDRPAFYADPIFYAGGYYVMDASSMFLEYLLKQLNVSKNAYILDIAAAPGGKSIILSNYLNDEGVLWSNEINFNRAKILSYNLSKWGKCNFLVTNNDSVKFNAVQDLFDVVVCDAPCSGSGLFRKYPEWMNTFNEKLVEQCVQRQKQILQNIFCTIKSGGYLIYSTCSFTSEENEDIAQFIINNGFEHIEIDVPQKWGILKSTMGLRFFPHLSNTEGFYYAVFQKINTSSTQIIHKFNKKNIPQKLPNKENFAFKDFIDWQSFHAAYQIKNKLFLSNQMIECVLSSGFNYLSIGTFIAEKNSHIPAAELALSLYLNQNILNLECSKDQAIKFLQKSTLHIHAEKNLYLLRYKNLGLGWIKVLENRVNNYFPTEWRILKDVE